MTIYHGDAREILPDPLMGMAWASMAELAQAIPPVYTKYIGEQALRALGRA